MPPLTAVHSTTGNTLQNLQLRARYINHHCYIYEWVYDMKLCAHAGARWHDTELIDNAAKAGFGGRKTWFPEVAISNINDNGNEK